MTTPNLAQQIAQFRSRYPFASLTSELLRVHNEVYVVRAIAQAGSMVIATAMAANSDLEKAEDRAKVRVLAMLQVTETLEHRNQREEPDGDSPDEDLPPLSQLTPDIAGLAPLTAIPESRPVPQLQPPSASLRPSEEGAESAAPGPSRVPASDSLPPMDDSIPGLDSPGVPAVPQTPPTKKPAPRLSLSKPAATSTEAAPAETTLNPKDLSDIIAKTSVELRRLGWTDEQGREHLQSAYGKRSRQQLTDPELVDFLRHLEQQPTPPLN
ncbi:MAG: hypothetical protein ACFB4J_05495 [Elainellaceae cyanobacterium]